MTRTQRQPRYTSAAEAWEFQRKVHESFGHRFGPPHVEEFTFVGTQYTAPCLNCGRLLFVSGGWGGPAAYGPCATTECAPSR